MEVEFEAPAAHYMPKVDNPTVENLNKQCVHAVVLSLSCCCFACQADDEVPRWLASEYDAILRAEKEQQRRRRLGLDDLDGEEVLPGSKAWSA